MAPNTKSDSSSGMVVSLGRQWPRVAPLCLQIACARIGMLRIPGLPQEAIELEVETAVTVAPPGMSSNELANQFSTRIRCSPNPDRPGFVIRLS